MVLALFEGHRLKKAIDAHRVQTAIEEAERRTSGEVRVCVAHFFWGSVERAADRAFARLGMLGTAQRNGVLFFVVPSRKRFVIIGDEGIHAKVGPEFWTRVAAAVSERFHARDFTGGLVQGIETVAAELSTHFPFDPDTDRDELPNTVDFDG
jgi:uncharacterized membrane protein